MASKIAFLVISWNTTRFTGKSSLIFLRFFNSCNTCQAMASPSRSGSEAKYSSSALDNALIISRTVRSPLACTSQSMAKSSSGRTDPFLAGTSRI